MRKKVLMLASILMLLGSYVLINRLQQSNFMVFNTVSPEKVQEIKQSHVKMAELPFTALTCNRIRVPFDEATNTFFVPLNMYSDKWEQMELLSGQPEYGVAFTEDVTRYHKPDVIAQGKKFDLIVYDHESWSNYYVVFSGLPIIDLSVNEGFYAEEQITGNAIFFDTDFSLHGVKTSSYYGHIRGNTSRMFPKKGYKLNLTYINEYGIEDGNKLSLFGMREDDDWILHALYNDDTKIRDRLSMEIWERIGATTVSENAYYGPNMTYVEVFADNQYCGLYGLMEPVDRKQLNLAEEDYSYKRKNPGGVTYKYDDFSEVTDPTAEVEGFEIKSGIMEEDAWMPMANLSAYLTLSDDERAKKSQDIINEDSLLRMWVFLQIITGHDHTAKNIYYVAKYDDDLKYNYQFYFAPWDLDLTWGNVSVGEINPLYTEFKMNIFSSRVYWETADWMIDSNYHKGKERAQNLYNELRINSLSDDMIMEIIETLDYELRGSGAFARDKERWQGGAHALDCSVLKKYAKERLNYLDIAINDFDYFAE